MTDLVDIIIRTYPLFVIRDKEVFLKCSELSSKPLAFVFQEEMVGLYNDGSWMLILNKNMIGGKFMSIDLPIIKEFCHQLFELGIEIENEYITEMVALKREWQINNILNE